MWYSLANLDSCGFHTCVKLVKKQNSKSELKFTSRWFLFVSCIPHSPLPTHLEFSQNFPLQNGFKPNVWNIENSTKNNQKLFRYQNHMKKQMQSSAWKAKLKKHLDIDLKIKTINNTLALKSKCKQFQIQIVFCCSQNCMKKWVMIVYCFFRGVLSWKYIVLDFMLVFCSNSESIYMVNVSLFKCT